jgi:hypothetical protein
MAFIGVGAIVAGVSPIETTGTGTAGAAGDIPDVQPAIMPATIQINNNAGACNSILKHHCQYS